jgi:hypothetical protein
MRPARAPVELASVFVETAKTHEARKGQRTSLPVSESASDKRRNSEVSNTDLVTEEESALVLREELLDLFDAGEEGRSLLVLAEEDDLVQGTGDDTGEAVGEEGVSP